MYIFLKCFGKVHKFQNMFCFFFRDIIFKHTFDDILFDYLIKRLIE
jgi:hypothetical protein